MSELPTQDAPSFRRKHLGRSVFVIPSLFTVANLFCGYYAILSTMHGRYQYAAYAIGIAIVLDSMDGTIARLTNSTSSFGLQLDSLADVISFGIAPSVLALVWGLSSVDERLAWITAFTYTICGAMRLARFNVQAGNLKHFVGLPIPAAGGAIAAIVHFFKNPIESSQLEFRRLLFLLSFLMISTIRYNSLKIYLWEKIAPPMIIAAGLDRFPFKTDPDHSQVAYGISVLSSGSAPHSPKKPGEDRALAGAASQQAGGRTNRPSHDAFLCQY
jgi:CDP-diacylglycerol--serine O-phosphatidyltransferase